jgi:hypothetical protein
MNGNIETLGKWELVNFKRLSIILTRMIQVILVSIAVFVIISIS